MENAVEALKTAAAVLIFAIAITVSFTMFSKAKVTADTIIKSQDKQEYLEAASLDNGVLYTSSTAIRTGESEGNIESSISGMTTKGDRIVELDDVISTIYRYNLEKYGVTILNSTGEVLVRFDSNTENIIRQWNNITQEERDKITDKIKENISNSYITNISLDLKSIYALTVDGNENIQCGAPWYGNDAEIIKRINADISGNKYTYNKQEYNNEGNSQKKLAETLNNSNQIVEVVNEIDNSKYLEDNGEKTSLLQQYELPTIEIIYILY